MPQTPADAVKTGAAYAETVECSYQAEYAVVMDLGMLRRLTSVGRWLGRVVLVAGLIVLGLPVLLAAQEGAAPEPAAPATPVPTVTGSAELPRDLSPLGMYLSADPLVKAVLIGLLFASIVTW